MARLPAGFLYVIHYWYSSHGSPWSVTRVILQDQAVAAGVEEALHIGGAIPTSDTAPNNNGSVALITNRLNGTEYSFPLITTGTTLCVTISGIRPRLRQVLKLVLSMSSPYGISLMSW